MSGFRLETVVDIGREPDDVFAFISDTRGFRALDPALVEVSPEGPLAAGMTGRFLHRRGGFPARTTWEVTRLDPPSRVAVELQGMGYRMTEDVELERAPVGTRAMFVERVWSTSLAGRLLVSLAGGVMRRDLRARAALLKVVLEKAGPVS